MAENELVAIVTHAENRQGCRPGSADHQLVYVAMRTRVHNALGPTSSSVVARFVVPPYFEPIVCDLWKGSNASDSESPRSEGQTEQTPSFWSRKWRELTLETDYLVGISQPD